MIINSQQATVIIGEWRNLTSAHVLNRADRFVLLRADAGSALQDFHRSGSDHKDNALRVLRTFIISNIQPFYLVQFPVPQLCSCPSGHCLLVRRVNVAIPDGIDKALKFRAGLSELCFKGDTYWRRDLTLPSMIEFDDFA